MLKGQNEHALVVGGGVVGLTAALALHTMGVCVSLIAKRKRPSINAPKRMYAIHLGSEHFLRSLGAWSESLLANAAAYQSIMVWEDVPDQLIFHADNVGKPYLGHIVNEGDLLKILWQNITMCRDIRLYEEEVVGLDAASGTVGFKSGESISADLILGADGAQSSIRRLGGFTYSQKSYEQTAIVATIGHERPHHQRLIQRFLPGGPVALLALKDPYQSSLVWTMSTSEAESMQKIDDQAFSEALTEVMQVKDEELILGKCQVLDVRHGFPLCQRHVEDYDQDKAVLVGDAAHTVHPLAGQGLNLGLMDVKRLVEALSTARQRSWGLADTSTLRQWSRDCHAENAKMQAAFTGINTLFASQNTYLSGLRQLGMGVVQRFPALKQCLVRQACGL